MAIVVEVMSINNPIFLHSILFIEVRDIYFVNALFIKFKIN